MVLCLVDPGFWHPGRALAFAELDCCLLCHAGKFQLALHASALQSPTSPVAAMDLRITSSKRLERTSDRDAFETIPTQCYEILSHWGERAGKTCSRNRAALTCTLSMCNTRACSNSPTKSIKSRVTTLLRESLPWDYFSTHPRFSGTWLSFITPLYCMKGPWCAQWPR